MATTQEQFNAMTKAQRKALAAKIAKDKDGGMTGQSLRDKYGSWLTGPVRRGLFREFGHGGLVAKSYDRAEAKVKREALQAKLKADSEAKSKSRKAQPAKAAPEAATTAPQAS
jgi:hypothetical protein